MYAILELMDAAVALQCKRSKHVKCHCMVNGKKAKIKIMQHEMNYSCFKMHMVAHKCISGRNL